MTEETTQADRATAHRFYVKAADGIATDWIEGSVPFDSEEIEDDVRDLAVMIAKVRHDERDRCAGVAARAAHRYDTMPEFVTQTATVRASVETAYGILSGIQLPSSDTP